jgi:tRNA-Thr(GGU) m(6)t(6)A37 methyltransferase TsaA
MSTIALEPVGRVESELIDRVMAPKQGHEGAPDAWIVFEPHLAGALDGMQVGDRIILLTWFDRADRATLKVHPRSNPATPLQGVFSTRSPDRPNPIGLHRVRVLEADGLRVRVAGLEALDGTPVVDVKPVLGGVDDR